MKKTLLLVICALFAEMIFANPVGVEKAQELGKKFAQSTLKLSQKAEPKLVYSGVSTRGEACFYVFNIGDEGFVIVSADDRFRPIVGYSDESVFETENMSPELSFYLEKIIEARVSPDAVLFEDTELEWKLLKDSGKLISRNGKKSNTYICQTKWNQDSPYNLYAPEASSGPSGRCYAGCVATAMSQVMKYWNHPLQGTGSHSYHCSYGTLSANFGATTYEWEKMPLQLNANSTDEEIEAVALLMYHCGIAVDMNFGPNGSGAFSEDVPHAISHYFSYSSQAEQEYRDFYSLLVWQNMLKESFDLNWPVYYSGSSNSGGHAFVCDGYDDNDLFHYNWGWGGSNDGWFVIDEIDYAGWASAVFNFVPTDVYTSMPRQPENVAVVSHNDIDCTATISWTNPTDNIHGNALSSIDQIVITRDGKVVHTEENVTPGASMEYTDQYLPTMVTYGVYAVVNSAKSVVAESEKTNLGPTCNWTIEMTASDGQGWNNGFISFVNSSGVEIAQASANSAKATQNVEMPLGYVYLYWNVPEQVTDGIGFNIKDLSGNSVVAFEGSSSEMTAGLFFIANTGNPDNLKSSPFDFTVASNGNDIVLNWSYNKEAVRYFVYRDGSLYDVSSSKSYTDNGAAGTFHLYKVSALANDGESYFSEEKNLQPESECEAPSNLRYEIANNGKIKLLWDAPQADGLSGYVIYRKGVGEEFKRIKLASSPTYTDNLNNKPCNIYQYAVSAYYSDSQCESAYASTLEKPADNFLTVNKTIIPLSLDYTIENQTIKLKWQEALAAESYDLYRDGELLASELTESEYSDDVVGQPNYCYKVVGKTAHLASNYSNEVCVAWNTSIDETADEDKVAVYPNPACGIVSVKADGLRNVVIYNAMGQEVMNHAVDGDEVEINVSAFVKGTYFVKISTKDGDIKVAKLIIVGVR